jgi:hypothetical protein
MSLLGEEYRVVIRHRTSGGEVVSVRQEGPWPDHASAQRFAERFTPPKFLEAWVEGRTVTHWGRV